MDVKVYKKEEVLQPSGRENVYVPDIIDLIPVTTEVQLPSAVTNNIWSLEQTKKIADVEIRDNKLIINSDKVRYENGNLYVTLTTEQIITCELLEDNTKELTEQECALSTIFQRGLDPLDLNDGIRWSEAILGEISPVQLMDDISNAVEKTSDIMTVEFDTVTDANNKTYLTYSLKEIA